MQRTGCRETRETIPILTIDEADLTRGNWKFFHSEIFELQSPILGLQQLGSGRFQGQTLFELGLNFKGVHLRPYQNNRKITKTTGKIPKSTNPNLTLLRTLTHTLTQTVTLNLTPFLTLTLTLTNWLRPLIAFFSCIWYCSVDFGTRSIVLVGQYICANFKLALPPFRLSRLCATWFWNYVA